MLKIRLQRFGKKKAPMYRIVVTEKSQKRDGKPVEVLGFYDPRAKQLIYNTARALYWKGVGAEPSETVKFLLNKQPLHDLANGPYKFPARSIKDKKSAQEELLKAGTKNTKAKKKKAEAAKQASESPEQAAA